jgi:hypothetical protein
MLLLVFLNTTLWSSSSVNESAWNCIGLNYNYISSNVKTFYLYCYLINSKFSNFERSIIIIIIIIIITSLECVVCLWPFVFVSLLFLVSMWTD